MRPLIHVFLFPDGMTGVNLFRSCDWDGGRRLLRCSLRPRLAKEEVYMSFYKSQPKEGRVLDQTDRSDRFDLAALGDRSSQSVA